MKKKLPKSSFADDCRRNREIRPRSFDILGEIAGLVEIPRDAWFGDPASAFWDENLDLFPDEPTFPRRSREVLCMERIFPLPEKIRHALIDVFCLSVNASTAKVDRANKDCLVRVLLGRRRFGISRPGGSKFFSLRNYKLHLDQVMELGLDAEDYANSMADTLAILHWHTGIDGMDIEFVLGSSPLDRNAVRRILPLHDIEKLKPGSSTYEHITNSEQNFKKRSVSLWLLDFDACSPITMDDKEVLKAVKAFVQTGPFCPRPNSNDDYADNLWKLFSDRYTTTGQKLCGVSRWRDLPVKFIEGITKELSHRR
ncbi:zinc finger protein-domain-containing protein [Penicillium sp. IBT 35674x]|nr:zinc finger protein-domain-containing protein [Penicillium sp. IBT 35674x]